jgi:predicted CopG family antitoxin
MKTINETFTDEEYKELIKMKAKLSWHKFILKLAKVKK